MNYFSNPGGSGALEESFGVLNRLVESHTSILESNPIGIIEYVTTFQTFDQFFRIIKVIRISKNSFSERIGPIQMSGNGSDLPVFG